MGKATILEDFRKAQIIGAALKKFSERGVCATTLEDIAREAGISKGGMAYYFTSRDALLKEAFKSFFDGIFQRSRKTMAACRNPLEGLLSFGWLYKGDDPDVNTGYPLLLDFTAMAVHDGECRGMYHQWLGQWTALLREAIQQGIEQGEFRAVDPDATARLISSIYHGIAMRWYLDREAHSTAWAVESFTKAISALMKGDAS